MTDDQSNGGKVKLCLECKTPTPKDQLSITGLCKTCWPRGFAPKPQAQEKTLELYKKDSHDLLDVYLKAYNEARNGAFTPWKEEAEKMIAGLVAVANVAVEKKEAELNTMTGRAFAAEDEVGWQNKAIEEKDAELARLRVALGKCKTKFSEYANIHYSKRTSDGNSKAEANEAMAKLCDEALNNPTQNL